MDCCKEIIIKYQWMLVGMNRTNRPK